MTTRPHFEYIMPTLSRQASLRSSYLAHQEEGVTKEKAAIDTIVAAHQSIHDLHEWNNVFHFVGAMLVMDLIAEHGDDYFVKGLPRMADFIFGLYECVYANSTPEAEFHTRTNLMYHLAQVLLHDKLVYEVTPGLAKALACTELRGLTTDAIVLPYPAIYLMVPEAADLKIYNNDSGWHKLVGAYIVEDTHHFYTLDGVRITGQIDISSLPTTRAWRFLLIGESKGEIKVLDDQVDDDALVYFTVPLMPGHNIDDILDETDRRYRQHNSETFTVMTDEWVGVFRWVMNAIVYATNVEAGQVIVANRDARQLMDRIAKLPKTAKKRDELKKRLNGMDPQRRHVLGQNIVVRRDSPEDTAGESKHHNGTSLTVRIRVAGHWRNVCHGTQHQQRRLQWIRSYWKGPEDGVFTSKVHTLT